MIIEFSVRNFRSIRELQTISFAATSLDSNRDKYPEVDGCNLVECEGHRLLKMIGIYGPNASGKSNIVKALSLFLDAIRQTPSPESRLGSLFDPFLYQPNAQKTECFFQIVILLNGKKYRYGFTVERFVSGFTGERSYTISSEWLFGPRERNQTKYFTRKGLDVQHDNVNISSRLPVLPYSHSLFLTHVASYDSQGICAQLWKFFSNQTVCLGTVDASRYRRLSLLLSEKSDTQAQLIRFLDSFGLSYDGIEFSREEGQTVEEAFQKNGLQFVKYSQALGQDGRVLVDLARHESDGTRKLFDMAGLMLRAFASKMGGLIVFDELDSHFHPSLVRKLVQIVNDPTVNLSNVQMLFTSHDTSIMDPEIMRRDQFYFAEKDSEMGTKVYALSDLKGIRNDADFARHYLAGFYGALPILGDFLLNQEESHG